MSRILIVGSGLTGSAVKFFLSNSLPALSGPTISMWEAYHTVGGRMQTDRLFGNHRCDLGAQYISKNVNGMLEGSDMYDYLVHRDALGLIGDNRTVQGMRPEHLLGQHYIAKTGTANMVASLVDDCVNECGKEVTGLEVATGTEKLVVLSHNAAPEAFDVVVLTVPAPQLVRILQHTQTDGSALVFPALIENLQQVRYSSRFALAVYYDFPSADAKLSVLDSVPWRAKYIFDDDVVRYVSIENFKYESETEEEKFKSGGSVERHILSVLVHTSVPYGLAHPEVLSFCSPQRLKDVHRERVSDLEQRKQDVIDTILQHLVTPGALPALSGHAPLRTRLVGWEQSQVSRGYYAAVGTVTSASTVGALPGAADSGAGPGADNSRGVLSAAGEVVAQPPAIVLSTANPQVNKVCRNEDAEGQGGQELLTNVKLHPVIKGESNRLLSGAAPLLVLAGDAFTESNFDGCVKSARYAAQAILNHVNSKQG